MRDFHKLETALRCALHIDSYQCCGRNSASDAVSARSDFPVCTKSGQRLVDGVHSIENTDVTEHDFSLTEIIEGVELNRSLTAS